MVADGVVDIFEAVGLDKPNIGLLDDDFLAQVKNLPELDPDFIPFGVWAEEYEKGASIPVSVAVEREDGDRR